MSLEKYKQVIHSDFVKDADFMDRTIKSFGLNKDSKILDIGTGLGAMSILLAINGFNVLTGQPKNDPEWEEIAAEHCTHNHDHEHHGHEFSESDWKENAKIIGVEDKIKFQYLNAEKLDFEDEEFDGIFMYDTLQHAKNREGALNECVRVLKSDGLLGVIEWNMKSIKQDEEEYGFTIDYVDPRDILNRDDISIELIPGTWINFFVIRKNS